MAAAIPSCEPKRFTAGDTVQWSKSLADYSPGDGWTLSYRFVDPETGAVALTANATTSGSGFLVTITAATTAAIEQGEYIGNGYVTKAGERYTVWSGRVIVSSDLTAANPPDQRSTAKKILDAVEAAWGKVAAKQVVRTTVDGVDLQFRTVDDLIKTRNYWLAVYNQEQQAAAGTRQRRCILARFTSPV